MKKNLLLGVLLMGGALFMNAIAQGAVVDGTNYGTRIDGKFKLTNKWIFSAAEGNYNTDDQKVGTSGQVRGMAVKDGKLLFPFQPAAQIIIYNGATGAKEKTVQLADNVFTYKGKTLKGDADSTWTVGYRCNDIHVDDAGNVLVSNMITSASGRFQVWKINLADGSGSVLVDTDIHTHYPKIENKAIRFDAFGVSGDVNGKAVIMALVSGSATNAALDAYQWIVDEGKIASQKPKLINVDGSGQFWLKQKGADGTYPMLANFGSAPRVLPINENAFIVDGNTTYPTVVAVNEVVDEITNVTTYVGNVLDGFYQRLNEEGVVIDTKAYKQMFDSVTVAGKKLEMNEGHNGLDIFELGGEKFIIMAATNNVKKPGSSFRLFKFASAAENEFKDMTTMWTFPLKESGETYIGMGDKSNAYRTGVPRVEVNGNVASIYLYTHENGYAKYELEYLTSGLTNAAISEVGVWAEGKKIAATEELKRIEVYAVNGQKVAQAFNVSEMTVADLQGIFLVNIVDKNGAERTEKIVIR